MLAGSTKVSLSKSCVLKDQWINCSTAFFWFPFQVASLSDDGTNGCLYLAENVYDVTVDIFSFIVVNASAVVVVSTARKKKVLGIVVAEPIINIV